MLDQLRRMKDNVTAGADHHYTIHLIVPAEDGMVHDDSDCRTRLHRITCPTCVARIADKRIQDRDLAFAQTPGAREIAKRTRRVAEAYTRLAEIEENLPHRPQTQTD